jgi:Ca-activated chloride channel family protein
MLRTLALFLLMILPASALAQAKGGRTASIGNQQAANGRIEIPSRASSPLFKGQQGKQKSEIYYDPATSLVTINLVIQDPNGYFIPNIRRENFVVYENGARQNADVDIEHAVVSFGLLFEFGGRAQALNKQVGMEASQAGRQILDSLVPGDKIAVWKYADRVEKLADFSQGKDAVDSLFLSLATPLFSETNLYDALVYTIDQMHPVSGRKAIVLISSGVDTFSKASYQDAVASASKADSPIYVICTAASLRLTKDVNQQSGPLARINWDEAKKRLQEIARVSSGRAYFPESTIDLSATYDDMMENLRVRYVIRYKSSTSVDLDMARTIRIDLVDPASGKPLQIIDSNGKPVHTRLSIQESYVPREAAASAASGQSPAPVVLK